MSSKYIPDDEELSILSLSPLFKGFNHNEITPALNCLLASKKTFSKSSCLFMKYDNKSIIYIILSGKLELSSYDDEGRKNIIGIYNKGDCVCEVMPSRNYLQQYQAFAKSKVELVLIQIPIFFAREEHSCIYRKRISDNLLKIMYDRADFLIFKHNLLSVKSLRQRFLLYLRHISHTEGANSIEISFNKTELAQFLSVDRSALSREISSLIDEGVLKVDGKVFTLIDSSAYKTSEHCSKCAL